MSRSQIRDTHDRQYIEPPLQRYEPLRILSIDMGIKNLGFAFLTTKLATNSKGDTSMLQTPELHHWERTALAKQQSASSSKPNREVYSDDKDVLTIDASFAKSFFEPVTLAPLAYEFVMQMKDFNPTHILIERQRFRSGGGAAVQEWSLRVGMLESMLHAGFHNMKREGTMVAVIESVLPARVNKYWFSHELSGDLGVEVMPGGISGKKAKEAKIQLVRNMLMGANNNNLEHHGRKYDRAFFQVMPSAQETALKFAGANSRQSNKLDDLADSVLQGLAWIRWQQNRLSFTRDHDIDTTNA